MSTLLHQLPAVSRWVLDLQALCARVPAELDTWMTPLVLPENLALDEEVEQRPETD
jgi:hypothetical protein